MTTPPGRRPARSASAIALKPMLPCRSRLSWPTVPMTRKPPAMPHRAPESAIANIIEPPALIPAYRAAVRLKPEARSSKPFVVRKRSHETATAMSSATTKP